MAPHPLPVRALHVGNENYVHEKRDGIQPHLLDYGTGAGEGAFTLAGFQRPHEINMGKMCQVGKVCTPTNARGGSLQEANAQLWQRSPADVRIAIVPYLLNAEDP